MNKILLTTILLSLLLTGCVKVGRSEYIGNTEPYSEPIQSVSTPIPTNIPEQTQTTLKNDSEQSGDESEVQEDDDTLADTENEDSSSDEDENNNPSYDSTTFDSGSTDSTDGGERGYGEGTNDE